MKLLRAKRPVALAAMLLLGVALRCVSVCTVDRLESARQKAPCHGEPNAPSEKAHSCVPLVAIAAAEPLPDSPAGLSQLWAPGAPIPPFRLDAAAGMAAWRPQSPPPRVSLPVVRPLRV